MDFEDEEDDPKPGKLLNHGLTKSYKIRRSLQAERSNHPMPPAIFSIDFLNEFTLCHSAFVTNFAKALLVKRSSGRQSHCKFLDLLRFSLRALRLLCVLCG